MQFRDIKVDRVEAISQGKDKGNKSYEWISDEDEFNGNDEVDAFLRSKGALGWLPTWMPTWGEIKAPREEKNLKRMKWKESFLSNWEYKVFCWITIILHTSKFRQNMESIQETAKKTIDVHNKEYLEEISKVPNKTKTIEKKFWGSSVEEDFFWCDGVCWLID